MKSLISALRRAIFPKVWVVTLSNDYGQTLCHTICARSYRAALREADSMMDSDWYSAAVHPAVFP